MNQTNCPAQQKQQASSAPSSSKLPESIQSTIAPIITACPTQAGPLYTTLNDLALSVGWRDLRVLDLEATGWAIIIGHKRSEDQLRAVLPLPIHSTSLRPSSLSQIFTALSTLNLTFHPPLPPLAPSMDQLRATVDEARREFTLRTHSRKLGKDSLNVDNDGKDEVEVKVATKVTSKEEEEKVNGQGEGQSEDQTQVEVKEVVDIDRETLYIAITTPDSTVVYYKLSKGIKKPADIPDE